jgi:hypothetical protein
MVGGSLRVLRLPPPLKTGRHYIAEILLKMTLNPNLSIKSIESKSWCGVLDTTVCDQVCQ